MRPRKIKLSPIESNVLRLLEEAGDEDMRTVRASVAATESELLAAIRVLEKLSFVETVIEHGETTVVLTARALDALARSSHDAL